jgi:hypothetical protein
MSENNKIPMQAKNKSYTDHKIANLAISPIITITILIYGPRVLVSLRLISTLNQNSAAVTARRTSKLKLLFYKSSIILSIKMSSLLYSAWAGLILSYIPVKKIFIMTQINNAKSTKLGVLKA